MLKKLDKSSLLTAMATLRLCPVLLVCAIVYVLCLAHRLYED